MVLKKEAGATYSGLVVQRDDPSTARHVCFIAEIRC